MCSLASQTPSLANVANLSILRHLAKATDENLTSEDWGAIIEVCDRVGSDANGPKEVVQAMIKRLAHRNANVQLYTLEVSCTLSSPARCCRTHPGTLKLSLTLLLFLRNSLRMPSARTVARICTASSQAEPSLTPC